MLQRAASNAYSWWWASHIRTNQSKWLDSNLQDVEEKVKAMLKIIDADADSFGKRAEMYYKKRPELMNFVEETYKAYRALAERFDRISGELHKANHTIATAFPDQIPFEIQDEDDDALPKAFASIDPSKMRKPPSEIPQINLGDKERYGQSALRKTKHSRVTSQLSKEKAHDEIDQLQKAILVLQTEREFIKSSYESGLAKFWDIEKQISEMQEEVCFLQDQFGASSVIEDDEARALMAAAALKSCEDTLVNLREQQNNSAEEARIQSERIKNAQTKLKILKGEYGPSEMVTGEMPDEGTGQQEQVFILKPGRLELQLICEKVTEHFQMHSESYVMELAEKIDKLVDKVISLELTVSSQTAEIIKLRLETDELHRYLQSLEEEKMSLAHDSKILSERLKRAECKLQSIQNLEKCVKDEKNILRTHFTEACLNLNDLSETLQSPKSQAQHIIAGPSQENERSHRNKEPDKMGEEKEVAKLLDTKEGGALLKNDSETIEGTPGLISQDQHSIAGPSQEGASSHLSNEPQKVIDRDVPCVQDVKDKFIEEHVQSQPNPQVGIDPLSGESEVQEGVLNLQQLLSGGLYGREKILLAEYTSILQSYKEMEKKLSEVEEKNQDSLSDIIAQLRELKSSNTMKDEEIRLLRQNLNLLQESSNDTKDAAVEKAKNPFLGKLESFSRFSKLRTQSSKGRISEMPQDLNGDPQKAAGTKFELEDKTGLPVDDISLYYVEEPPAASAVEEKFRRDIDGVLEENLEFWLRFSSTFHHVQKLQNTFDELQTEIEKVTDRKSSDSGRDSAADKSGMPGSTPMDKELRELKTELQVWLEQNAMLKGELKQRFSSLCGIQDEIARVLKESSDGGEMQFSPYQAAKFQGEVLNMQLENNRVANELQAGLDHVRGLQVEVEKALSKLHEKVEISGSRSSNSSHHHNPPRNVSSSKNKIPLRSFLYGVKPKKPSIFSCMSPALQKHHHNHMQYGLSRQRH